MKAMTADPGHPERLDPDADDERIDLDPDDLERLDEDELEPAAPPSEPAAAPPTRSGELSPLELEEAERGSSHAESLNDCPNCGAPMTGADSLVCLRCGFDLKTLRVIESAVDESPDEEPEEELPARPLVRPLMGEPLLPTLLSMASIGVVLVALLAGLEALFPAFDATQPEALTVPWQMRLVEAARLPVFMCLWLACGFSALLIAAWLFGRPLGDFALAAWRMLAVVAIGHLVVFFDIARSNTELFLEAIAHAVAFFVLIMLLFRLKPRDAATVLGVMVVLYGALVLLSRVVVWATSS